jgi:hypothetical protein
VYVNIPARKLITEKVRMAFQQSKIGKMKL